MALAPSARARHSLAPPHRSGRETFHDAAGFASCYGPHRRSPSFRAFDAGLRPRPFPDEAASLLPGPLAATRTGLPPAGDDELTNKIHRYITASPPALLGARCGTPAPRRPSPQTDLVIKADQRLKYGDVKEVMKITKEAGFQDVGLIVDKKTKGTAG